uniref:Uncharacterized protein n=1 Tax=Ditylenchus dipsaci TaxID=166011 RepID=A0A915E3R5_9BILA
MLQLGSKLSKSQSRSLRQVSSYYIAPQLPTSSPSPPSISPPPNYKEFLAYFPSLDPNKNNDYYDQQPFEVPQKSTTTAPMPSYKHETLSRRCENWLNAV